MKLYPILLLLICGFLPIAGVAKDITTIQQQLNKIRQQSGVHAIAVSIVNPMQPPIYLTTGYADTSQRTPLSAKTQFRFGSISKIVVALAVMKLVEQGKLTLETPLQQLAPNLQFTNPWSNQHPVRVIHLLNHTSGWDAMHFAENQPVKGQPIEIAKALALHPDNRESRWPPGTRMAYNNTGPLVAAYLVEQLSGMSFESFVKQHLFAPLEMHNSDYFFSDNYRQNTATLYLGDQPLPYQHLNNRAAGGLNSNLTDMTKLLHFLMQPQQYTSLGLSSSSLQQMQTPSDSLAANAGITLTYAQGLNRYHHGGAVLYGHEGSVRGGSAMLLYQPNINRGYVIAVTGEGPAIPKVHRLLADYITQDVAPKEFNTSSFTEQQQKLSGYYRSINPQANLIAPFTKLLPWRFTVNHDRAIIGPMLGGKPRQLRSLPNAQFGHWSTGEKVLAVTQDPLVGKVVQYGPHTLQPISKLSALLPIVILTLWLITGFAVMMLFALRGVRVVAKQAAPSLPSKRLTRHSLQIMLSLTSVIALLLIAKNSTNLLALIAKPSWLSITLCLASVGYFTVSMWALWRWWCTKRGEVQLVSYTLLTAFISLNAVVAAYLLLNGLIGVRLWA